MGVPFRLLFCCSTATMKTFATGFLCGKISARDPPLEQMRASFQLHYFNSSGMAVLWCLWLGKWGTANAVQPAPPLKIYHRLARGRGELRLEFQEAVWRLCLAACP